MPHTLMLIRDTLSELLMLIAAIDMIARYATPCYCYAMILRLLIQLLRYAIYQYFAAATFLRYCYYAPRHTIAATAV